MITKVQIGSIDYQVEPAKRDKDFDDFGMTITQTATIVYKKQQTKQQLGNTLLHECFHGVWDDYNLKDKEDEESAITALTNGLCALFRNNPDFYHWLGESLDIPNKGKK